MDIPPPLRSLVVLAGLTAASGCAAPALEITPRVGFVDIGGDLAWARQGDVLAANSTDALGLGDDESVFLPRADFEFGPFEWILDYGSLSYAGSGAAIAPIEIGEVQVGIGEPVDSSVDVTLYRSTFLWDLFPTDTLDIALGFGLGGAEVQSRLADPVDGTRAESDEIVPLPYAAARLGASFGDFGVEGLLGVFALDIDEVEVSYLDADAHFYWQVLDTAGSGVRVLVGARYVGVSAEYDDDNDRVEVDLDFTGPYVGLSLVL